MRAVTSNLRIPKYLTDIPVMPVEICFKKQKLLVAAIYVPPSQRKNYFITELTKILNNIKGSHESTVILGDLSIQPIGQIIETFFSFSTLIKSNKTRKLN